MKAKKTKRGKKSGALTADAVLLELIYMAAIPPEDQFEKVLKIIASSDDPKSAATLAHELQRKHNAAPKKKARGRREQTVAEFERTHQADIAVAKLKWQEDLTDAEALRQISEKNKVDIDALRVSYYRNKHALDRLVQANNPRRK